MSLQRIGRVWPSFGCLSRPRSLLFFLDLVRLNVSVYPRIVVDNQLAGEGSSSMNENLKNFLPGEIFSAGKEREARLAQLSTHVTAENMHDGSPTSLEFARLAVEILDEYLESIDFLLASPLLPALLPGDKERLEAHQADFRVRRAKAQRAVELNLERSLEIGHEA